MYHSFSGKMRVMVKTCVESRNGISVEEAHAIDQRSFGAVWRRGHDPKKPPHKQVPPWLDYNIAKDRFFATGELKEIWREDQNANIFRNENCYYLPLTKYFDPKAYGLNDDTALHVVRKKKRVA